MPEASLRSILQAHGFVFSKAKGQNFLVDSSVCPRMAAQCGATKADAVLEIGPGAGVLTRELAQVASQVLAIELDARLLPVLEQTLCGCPNATVLLGDALKLDLPQLCQTHLPGKRVFVCANLPYYITTPILMRLLACGALFAGVTVMVQKEMAERICAPLGSRSGGAITVAVQYYARVRALFHVKREAFFPVPHVDSTVVQLLPHAQPPVPVANAPLFFKVVRAAFAQRRKTLANALSAGLGLTKHCVQAALQACGIAEQRRAETLDLQDFFAVYVALEPFAMEDAMALL